MMARQTPQQQSPQAENRSHTHQDLEVEAPCHQTRAEVVGGEAGKVLAEGTEHTPSPHNSTGRDSFRDNNQSPTTLDTQQRPRPQIAQQHANYGVLSAHNSDKGSGTTASPAAPCCPIPFLPLQPAISEQQEQEHQQGQSGTQEQRAPRWPQSQRQQQPAHGPSGGQLDRFPLAESQSSQGQLATLAQLQSQQVRMPAPLPSIIMPQRGEHASDDDHKGLPHQAAGEPDQGCCCDTEFVESTSSSPRRVSSSSNISNSSSNSNSSHSGPNSVPRCPRSSSLALTGPGAALSRPSFLVARSLSSSSTSSLASTSSSSSSSLAPSSSSSPLFSPSSAYSYISPALPSPLLYTRKRSVARTSLPFPSFSLSPPASTKDDPPRSLLLLPSPTPHHKAARLRQKSVPNLSLGSTLSPRPSLSRSPSLSLLPFCGTLTSPNHGETTTSTTLSCAYPQPFLSVPSASPSENRLSPVGRISNTSTTSLLRNLDSLSAQISPDPDMTRQRSMSTSSLGTLAKSPSSLTASLSASVALYDSHQPPKTLQDILLLAQSHYISHRYVPALTLYRLAAEKHHSLPACCSLYALYTSTVKTPGLVRSDTKAAEVLIHALRIWTARRWSGSGLDGGTQGSMRSKTRDDHAELEEYFAHPRNASSSSQSKAGQRSSSSAKNNHQMGASTIPISSRRDSNCRTIVVAESAESEYRRPELRHLVDGSESKDSASGSESGSDDDDEDEESEEDDCDSECEACQDCDGGCEHCMDSEEEEEEDEEQAKEEEARRIGLATMEIEDIVQKLCSMIQKGVLGLDEAVVVEAISMVRKIERGLSKDGEAWQAQMAKSKSLFESSLSGGKIDSSEGRGSSSNCRIGGTAAAAGLLLTQSIDLSFLNLTPENTSPMSQVRAVDLSSRKRAKAAAAASTSSSSLSKSYPVNAAISRLSIGEQEAEQAICRAMRIRIMFTLGWVHQQRGEYHWGAQAYGVCSEVTPPTGKRLLVSLQQQATVQKWTCLAFEKKAQEQQAQAEEDERQRVLAVEQQQQRPDRIPSPSGSTQQQQQEETQRHQPRKLTASPSYTSSEVSTAAHHHADISSPSSYSSSESAAVSIRGSQAGTTISSLSAAMWSSGLFKSSTSMTTTPSETSIPTASNATSTTTATTLGAMVEKPASPAGTPSSVQSDPTSKSSANRQLHRSKSVLLGLKINTLNNRETPQQETKEKEPHHHHQHHHPRAQHRSKGQGHHPHAQGGSAAAAVAAAVLTMTMSDHQKKVVKCGHCGQKRILMPLCVCKRVRYCNRECRIADLEAHRKTGCHAALMSTSGGSMSSTESASAATAAAVAVSATAAAGPGVSM